MRLAELDVNAVLSLLAQELPGASVVAFDDQLQVVMAHGLDYERTPAPASEVLPSELWFVCEPLFRRALTGEESSAERGSGERLGRRRIDVGPLHDSGGAVVGGVCVVHDVSEVELLREELDQQRQLLELAHDAIIVRDPRYSSITYWNREAEEIYGYSAGEAYGQVTHELLDTVLPGSREAVDQALAREDRWDGELRHRRKDGRQIVVSSRQALVRDDDGHPVAVIELNSDITERVRGERALREAEQQFRGLMESAPDAMVIVNEQGAIVFVNARAEELFQYARSELVGQDVEMLLPRALRKRHVLDLSEFGADPKAREMGAGIDLLAQRKDGTDFLAEISLSPLHIDNGLLISTSIRDISKQLLRQLEQALVPRMKIDDRWQLAWRYRPSVNTMLLGGDFIGVAERANGSLSLLIGDVTGHGPSAAGTGAMLRAAWLGAVQAEVELESIPRMLDRLLVDQADVASTTLATVCLVEVDPGGRELQLIRAGHDSPLLITRDGVTALHRTHGPALGFASSAQWPVRNVELPHDAAIMLFTDGPTERRLLRRRGRLGFDELLPQLDVEMLLDQAPERAIDEMLERLFPEGTEALDDDLAVILVAIA